MFCFLILNPIKAKIPMNTEHIVLVGSGAIYNPENKIIDNYYSKSFLLINLICTYSRRTFVFEN